MTQRTMKSLVKRFEALGITFQTLSPSPLTEGWTQIEKRGPSFAWGPAGGACDIATREVWMEHLKPHEVLHEAMHVLLAVPKIPIENQPDEGLFLMPIERAYAQVLLNKKALVDCIDWQESTVVQWGEDTMELHLFESYGSLPFWHRALRLGVELGVLDAEHQPTFAWPNWSKISPSDMRFLRSKHREKRRQNQGPFTVSTIT